MTTESAHGSKVEELTEYDHVRLPHIPITEDALVGLPPRSLDALLVCPICLDLMEATSTTSCLHRFCTACITNSIGHGNKECPTCRAALPSRRSLRPDPNFDRIIAQIYPDRSVYQSAQMARLELLRTTSNLQAIARSVQEGKERQAATRSSRVTKTYLLGISEDKTPKDVVVSSFLDPAIEDATIQVLVTATNFSLSHKYVNAPPHCTLRQLAEFVAATVGYAHARTLQDSLYEFRLLPPKDEAVETPVKLVEELPSLPHSTTLAQVLSGLSKQHQKEPLTFYCTQQGL
eukprot:m.61076 g.61076  ORF g.61076 m.61076 type:complete len:290 (+) comp11846_c0_seq2:75-944(+)